MTSKYKSEGNLFLAYKKAPDTDDLYDPSLIGVTYNEKNSEIGIKCQHIQRVCKKKPANSWDKHLENLVSIQHFHW